jgi:tRNA-2-methylthio-N6-dimethylallyladenosine synthase
MSNGITALVSITRGVIICALLCSPFYSRSQREPQSIMKEIQDLWDKGFKEILGQM